MSSAHVGRSSLAGGQAQPATHARIEGAQLVGVEGVGQREHGPAVLDLAQRARLPGEPTRCVGESGVTQLRVGSLEVGQLAEEPVVLGVGELRRVLLVVQAVGSRQDARAARLPGPAPVRRPAPTPSTARSCTRG